MNQNSQHFECHLDIDRCGNKLVEVLHIESGLSRQKLKQVMQKGAIWLTRKGHTRRVRRAETELKTDDRLHLYYDAAILQLEPSIPELVADEGEYSIWYKPYGVLCQGSKWGDHCTIQRWVEGHIQPQRPVFIVHRLDRAATGLIILAHSKNMATAFSHLFRQRKIVKRYRVIVEGEFPPSKTITVDQPVDDKWACSHLSRVEYDRESHRSLLDIRIETGRKHQIRRHCAGLGFPVVGDRLHGCAPADSEDLQLCAWQLEFICPLSGQNKHYQLDQMQMPGFITDDV